MGRTARRERPSHSARKESFMGNPFQDSLWLMVGWNGVSRNGTDLLEGIVSGQPVKSRITTQRDESFVGADDGLPKARGLGGGLAVERFGEQLQGPLLPAV